MRGPGPIVFVAGFVAGVVVLGLLAWRATGWRTTAPAAVRVAAGPSTAGQPPAATPRAEQIPPPRTAVPAPPSGPRLSPPPDVALRDGRAPQSGDAAREIASGAAHMEPEQEELLARKLLVPVKGAGPADLVDTFGDPRSGGRSHEALDIMAPRGTPVIAADEGNVVKLFDSKQGGLTVYQFDNSQRYCYYYAHLDRYAAGLKEGTLLRKGDVLGYVGSTGDADADAPHLHFAIFKLGPEKKWWEGEPINPYPILTRGQEAEDGQ